MVSTLQERALPLVHFYMAAKNNQFLSTAVYSKESTFLEKAGNSLLKPWRRVVSGRELHVDGEKKGNYSAYSQQPQHLTRLFIASQVLESLFLVPLGAAMKGAALLFSETARDNRALLQDIRRKPQSHGLAGRTQEDLDKQPNGFKWKDSEAPPLEGLNRPRNVKKTRETQKGKIAALRALSGILNKHNIPHWIDFGTTLGAYRYGGIIPWDHDLDIAIPREFHFQVAAILAAELPGDMKVQNWSGPRCPQSLLKVYCKNSGDLIDIYHYDINERSNQEPTINYVFPLEYTVLPTSVLNGDENPKLRLAMPLDTILPLRKAQFEDMTVWVPNKTKEYLHIRYGENLDPVREYNEETGKYEKVKDHPYWQEHQR